MERETAVRASVLLDELDETNNLAQTIEGIQGDCPYDGLRKILFKCWQDINEHYMLLEKALKNL